MMQEKSTELGTLEFYQGEYGNEFRGEVSVKLFSKIYNVHIRFDVFKEGFEGLSDYMIEAARNCLNVINHHHDIVEQAIKGYYDTKVKVDSEEGFCDYIEMDDLSQLSQVMSPQELYIVDLRKSGLMKDVKVGLYFDCDWDEQDGFGIRFDGEGNIVRIGSGGVIY